MDDLPPEQLGPIVDLVADGPTPGKLSEHLVEGVATRSPIGCGRQPVGQLGGDAAEHGLKINHSSGDLRRGHPQQSPRSCRRELQRHVPHSPVVRYGDRPIM
ncbi:MAG: hypothetical protein J2P23_09285 [Microlunatus sp.]|nr:hypothetical protein [Microlunatus sp.]